MGKPIKANTRQCKSCLYRSNNGDDVINCYYILFMGHSRGCEPSPNCTKYKRFTQPERRELERNTSNF